MAALRTLFVVGLLILPPTTHADILDRLTDRSGFAGQFTQQILDDRGQVLATSSGGFAVLAPDYFRWDIEAPDHQLIVIDGQQLWQYDRDLETVMARPAPDAQTSPLQLLTADRDTLEARYMIDETGASATLTPRYDNDFFSQLVVRQSGPKVLMLEIHDNFEQQVMLELVLGDTTPEPTDFKFSPPPDVEWLEGAPLATE